MDHSTRRINPDFVLNDARYAGATILLARDNFGCGSSREHAPWAILEYGLKAVIAPSFADIFFNNSFKNGLLPVVLTEAEVDTLFDLAGTETPITLTVDLRSQQVTGPEGFSASFVIDPFRKTCLLEGLDEIGLSLKDADAIRAYEARRRGEAPWLLAFGWSQGSQNPQDLEPKVFRSRDTPYDLNSQRPQSLKLDGLKGKGQLV